MEEAKKKVKEQGIEDWKKQVKTKPPKLDLKLKTIITQMYLATANELTKKKMFAVPKLVDIVKEYQKY